MFTILYWYRQFDEIFHLLHNIDIGIHFIQRKTVIEKKKKNAIKTKISHCGNGTLNWEFDTGTSYFLYAGNREYWHRHFFVSYRIACKQ